MPDQGAIVLVPIPFTDRSSHKRRPVIVISNNEYNRRGPDVVVVAMTSNPIPAPYSITVTSADLSRGALNRPGTVRVNKVYTLHQSLVARVFGQVNPRTVARIRTLLGKLIARKP